MARVNVERNDGPERRRIARKFRSTADVVLQEGDCLESLRSLPSETVQLIVTSPPYNVGKSYEAVSSLEEYVADLEPIIENLVRVLRPSGSLCWQVGNHISDGEIVPLDYLFYATFKKLGLKLRSRIVWSFEHGLHASRRFSGRYEILLWFTKGNDYVFNLDDVRVPSKYPGKRSYKGPNKGKPSSNPLGKNPSDVWKFVLEEWERGVWEIPNVKAHHREKTIHPCQFPIELVERCVLALSNENDWLLDPFAGVATSLLAAIRNNRRAVGFEKEKAFAKVGRARIRQLWAGTLPYRPLGMPIQMAKGRVARIPEEWLEITEAEPPMRGLFESA